ncbi:MAG: hypothetical protein NC319_07470 [Butyricicoccus sp.]|nr:hypothetical protein [Butyricicoccus sp.]
MTEVISVKFKSRGKTYYFAPNGLTVADGAQVVVETAKGLELADCVKGNHFVTDESIIPPLRPAVRLATADDLRIAALCRERERDAFRICEEKIAQRGLDMKLVDVECSFEGSKILFFFTSDGRVDFRELVKDLAGVFRTRIELRQIGVRDEAKMIGGLGICGRAFCCSQFLDEFQPVSTKMAKVQSLSLNPAKISGSCGRLMCCLRYEQEAYEELVKTVPKNGAFVETPAGYGNVTQVNLLRQKVKVRLDGGDESLRTYDADEVAAVPGGRPRPGEPLPHVLKIKARPMKPAEPEENEWLLPELFSERMYITPEPAEKPAPEPGEKKTQRRSRRKKSGAKPGGQPQPKQNADAPRSTPRKPPEPDKSASGNKPSNRRGGGKKPSEPAAQPSGKNPQRGGGQKPRSDQPAPKANAPKPAAEGEKKKRPNRRYYRGPKPGGAPKSE